MASTATDSLSAPALRIGFVSARSCFRDGRAIWTDAGLGRLIDALRLQAGELTVGLAVAPVRDPLHDHAISLASEQFFPLPALPGFAGSVAKGGACRAVIRQIEGKSDVTIVQLPFAAPTALLYAGGPRVYHVCADTPAIVRTRQFSFPRRMVTRLAADAIEALFRSLARGDRTRVVANGAALLQRFGGKGRAVISSSIGDRDVGSVRRARPVGGRFRMLYAGYLRPEKGVDTLVASFEQVLAAGVDAELEIVGARDGAEHDTQSKLLLGIESLSNRGRVSLRGHLPFGRDLFQAFADADVVVVPSRSEGTPRVLVEARAFGCPVIGTRVGGIPSSIQDGIDGLLVPADDVGGLTDAIIRIARDEPLRARLIAAGLERARRTTVESFARSIIEEAQLACALR